MKVVEIQIPDAVYLRLGSPSDTELAEAILNSAQIRLERSVQEKVQAVAKAQLKALPPLIVNVRNV